MNKQKILIGIGIILFFVAIVVTEYFVWHKDFLDFQRKEDNIFKIKYIDLDSNDTPISIQYWIDEDGSGTYEEDEKYDITNRDFNGTSFVYPPLLPHDTNSTDENEN